MCSIQMSRSGWSSQNRSSFDSCSLCNKCSDTCDYPVKVSSHNRQLDDVAKQYEDSRARAHFTYRHYRVTPNLRAEHASAEICRQITSLHDSREFWQTYKPGPDRRLLVIDATHFDWVLACIAREVLDALQRVDVLENFNEVRRKQIGPFLEPWRQNEETGSERVPAPSKFGKGCVINYAIGPSHDG